MEGVSLPPESISSNLFPIFTLGWTLSGNNSSHFRVEEQSKLLVKMVLALKTLFVSLSVCNIKHTESFGYRHSIV